MQLQHPWAFNGVISVWSVLKFENSEIIINESLFISVSSVTYGATRKVLRVIKKLIMQLCGLSIVK